MSRRPLLIRTLIAPMGLGVLVLTTACGTAGTPVTSVTPTGASAVTCDSLRSELPSVVDGQKSRPVLPPSTFSAAWGDPPVVLRCGVPDPSGLEATSQLFTIDGIDWFPETGTDATTFTTTGRAVNVEVTVPRSLSPEAAVLTDLAPAITKAVPITPSR